MLTTVSDGAKKVTKRCQQSTADDRHLLITLGVQLCAQRDGRLGATQRRAGPSASAETCMS